MRVAKNVSLIPNNQKMNREQGQRYKRVSEEIAPFLKKLLTEHFDKEKIRGVFSAVNENSLFTDVDLGSYAGVIYSVAILENFKSLIG